jgi:hypothetical protein
MEGCAVSHQDEEPQAAVTVTAVLAAPAAPLPAPAAVLAGGRPPPLKTIAVPARVTALARAHAAATQLAPQVQYQLARLGPYGQSGLVALVAAVVFASSALLPTHQALEALNADLAHAQHSATGSAGQSVPRLIESLPTRQQIPAVVGVIYAQAKQAGVGLDTGHYTYSPAKAGGMARYELDFPVKASYPDIRNFINHTLTAVPAAALDKLHVERKTVGDPLVNADIGFTVFVRGE